MKTSEAFKAFDEGARVRDVARDVPMTTAEARQLFWEYHELYDPGEVLEMLRRIFAPIGERLESVEDVLRLAHELVDLRQQQGQAMLAQWTQRATETTTRTSTPEQRTTEGEGAVPAA